MQQPRDFASGYQASHRLLEILAVVVFFVQLPILCFFVVYNLDFNNTLGVMLALACGWLLADLFSGLVHWLADTWGTPDWPIIGASLIRPFREHHVDPLAMTRHDFFETNGNSCLVVQPALWGGLALATQPASDLSVIVIALIASLSFWIMMVNQVHKWSHLASPPRWVRWLQRTPLILSPRQHNWHHRKPFTHDYCIVSGVLNAPLRRIRFFRSLEAIIHRLTGAVPRADDIGLALALEVAELERLNLPRAKKSPRSA